MAFVRMNTTGYDGIVSHSIAAVSTIGQDSTIYLGISSLIESTGVSVFPIFFALLPLGFFGFFKNRNFDKYTVLLFLIFMLMPIIYASSRGITEPRYLLVLFPIFSLISIYTIKEITEKFDKTKFVLIIFVVGILLSSIVFLDYNIIDYEHELEAYDIGLEVSRNTSVISDYHPESKYAHNKIDVATNLETFPILSSEIKQKVKLIETYGFYSLNEFIVYGERKGLTHIVVDDNQNRSEFLKDVFGNEEKYVYLSKIYDSSEHGYDYHLKIFRIDYEKFDSVK